MARKTPSEAGRKLVIVTGGRADWGLLSPLAALARHDSRFSLGIVATNMHLMPRYGNTVDEILAEGFDVDARVPLHATGTPADTVGAMAEALTGMADAFTALQPDIVVILGDRFEMLSAATAAMILGIRIAHIAGGETTLGAIDDRIRHAITQMATWHFTETAPYRDRVIAMGADPAHSYNVGALGVWNALHEPQLPLHELRRSIGLSFTNPTLLVTFHPATADMADPCLQMHQLLLALDDMHAVHGADVLFTYPNNDPRSQGLIPMIEQWSAERPQWVRGYPSLGKQRYLSVLRHVQAVVGNSSSGIIEVPSMGIPTVDIGLRQQGRIGAESVIHCSPEREAIAAAVGYALSLPLPLDVKNPYECKDTPRAILEVLARSES